MRETVLQFGTGNFLRAFADAFIDQLNQKGLYDGGVVIVSPTDSAAVEKINAQQGKYRLILRGIRDGKEYCETQRICSVTRAINPYHDYASFLELAGNPDLRFIISNTTEAGIAYDASCCFGDVPPASFPAKLTRFLFERFKNALPGFIVLPCELIDNNGKLLREYVYRYAAQWELPREFAAWLQTENVFSNTLVDRIVTGFPTGEKDRFFEQYGEDLLLDTAEPYHLWVIEGDYENELPLKRGGVNVIWTNDVSPYKKMKVRILNGLHTTMVFPGLLAGLETVADCMNDEDMRPFIESTLRDVILPTLEESGEINAFASAVKERFLNPHLHHRLASISLNSVSKFNARILPVLCDRMEQTGRPAKQFALALASMIVYYKYNTVNDAPAAVDYIKSNPIDLILRNTELWNKDLSFMSAEVRFFAEIILAAGIREAIRCSV